MDNPYLLPSDQVVGEAKRLAARLEPPHWSELAAIVSRIDRERLYAADHETLRAFALAELEMAPRDLVAYLQLASLLEAGLPRLRYESWAGISKARALAVLAAVRLGGDIHDWFAKARDARSAKVLDDELGRARGGRESWTRLELDVPGAVAELIEAALTLAIPVRYGDAADLEFLHDQTKRAELLETVAEHFINCPSRGPLDAVTGARPLDFGWYCMACGQGGRVQIPLNEGLHEGVQRIVTAHTGAAPRCAPGDLRVMA